MAHSLWNRDLLNGKKAVSLLKLFFVNWLIQLNSFNFALSYLYLIHLCPQKDLPQSSSWSSETLSLSLQTILRLIVGLALHSRYASSRRRSHVRMPLSSLQDHQPCCCVFNFLRPRESFHVSQIKPVTQPCERTCFVHLVIRPRFLLLHLGPFSICLYSLILCYCLIHFFVNCLWIKIKICFN